MAAEKATTCYASACPLDPLVGCTAAARASKLLARAMPAGHVLGIVTELYDYPPRVAMMNQQHGVMWLSLPEASLWL